MREPRTAHVRPKPPSSDRMPSRIIRASGPPSDTMRHYRPVGRSSRMSPPAAMVVAAICIVLGLLTLTVGTGLMAGLVGGIADAFGNSLNRMTSQAPATLPPSGIALDTPVLDAPPNDGYTTLTSALIRGSVPGPTVGKTGYSVHVYALGTGGSRREVANISVGGTTRFITPAIALTEGQNSFTATLASPSGEGQPSPPVTYILDTKPPKITVSSPADGAKVSVSRIDISGSCDTGSRVTVRNEQAPGGALNSQAVGADGKFKLGVPLVAGANTIDVMAEDQAGNTASKSITVNRGYGHLAAHLAVTPSKFSSASQVTLKLTLHATSIDNRPLAGAEVVFTVTIQGLAPIVSPSGLKTDSTGTATWEVTISGASPGTGQASVLVADPDGNQVTATAGITIT